MAIASISDRLLRGEQLSVKMFGAVQDGSTDDRAAIQAAFDFAASRNVPLLIPGGNPFLVGGQLTVPSGLILRGRRGAVLKQKDGSATMNTPFITGASLSGIHIQGVTVDGNRAGNSVLGVSGWFFNGIDGLVMEDCETVNTSGNGVGGLLWKNVQIRNQRASAWGLGNDYAAIYLQNGTYVDLPTGDSYKILIEGCNFDGTGSGSCVKLTATEDAPLRGVRVVNNDVYVGYPGATPPFGTPDALGIEVWSGPSGTGGNHHSETVIANNRIDSEFDSGRTYGRTWGISISQGAQVVVGDNKIKNCGVFAIELIGSQIVCGGNQCENCGPITVIVSSLMADQELVQVGNNSNITREGDQYGIAPVPLAAMHIYIEGASGLSHLQITNNNLKIQGAQRGIWLQANGAGAMLNGNISENSIVGDGTTGAYGIALSPDGLGSSINLFTIESNRFSGIDTALQNGAVNARFLWNVFNSDVGTRYGGVYDATCMIVDVSGPEGSSFAPPAVRMRGREHDIIGPTGDLFLDQADDRSRFATADDGVDPFPNVINYERTNFGTELQGGYVAVNSRWDGDPNWVQTSTSAYARAMFMLLGAARWAIRFGLATNADGSEPGDIAFQIIDGNNTRGEAQRVGTGAGFPFEFEASGRMVYVGNGVPAISTQPGSWYIRLDATGATDLWYVYVPTDGWTPIQLIGILSGAGDPEGVVSADPGMVYRRTTGGAGISFYIKESGTGNTGWKSDGGTIWFPTANGFRASHGIGINKDPASGIDLDINGGVQIDGGLRINTPTASLPLKLNATKDVISALINLASSGDVTGVLPTANGGWDESRIAALESAVAAIQAILAPGATNSVDPSAVNTLEFSNGIFTGNT